MTRIYHPSIGDQRITATLQPKMGDREDFLVHIQGPDPNTDFNVPLSITGTALAIWGNPNPTDAAEELAEALFKVSGTATLPPPEGFWLDSYNSDDSIRETAAKIANQGTTPFIKNAPSALFLVSLGQEVNTKIQELDAVYSQKYSEPFFHSLEDMSEESQRVDDLNSSPTNNAEYLYRISILSGIIDHIEVRLTPENDHSCTDCGQRHIPSEGSLQGLRRWLANILGDTEANRLTSDFQMIKNLRKQYPIHDTYITANNIRRVRTNIENANAYFGISTTDFARNTAVVTEAFSNAIEEIKTAIENLS